MISSAKTSASRVSCSRNEELRALVHDARSPLQVLTLLLEAMRHQVEKGQYSRVFDSTQGYISAMGQQISRLDQCLEQITIKAEKDQPNLANHSNGGWPDERHSNSRNR